MTTIENTQTTRLKIILIEDHCIVREAIKMILSEQDDMQIVYEASSVKDVLSLLEGGIDVDIIISDINMPDVSGMELIDYVTKHYPSIKTIVLTMLDTEVSMHQCFRTGCAAYLTKTIEPEELVFAIRQVARGNKFLCPISTAQLIATTLQHRNKGEVLGCPEYSDREIEVLELIAQGLTNQEIADKMFLSKRTVEGHRQSLIDKSGSRNTAALIRYAISHDLIL